MVADSGPATLAVLNDGDDASLLLADADLKAAAISVRPPPILIGDDDSILLTW